MVTREGVVTTEGLGGDEGGDGDAHTTRRIPHHYVGCADQGDNLSPLTLSLSPPGRGHESRNAVKDFTSPLWGEVGA